LAEESKRPRRDIPITLYASILILSLLYLLSSFAAVVGFAGIGGKDPMGNLANDAAPFLTLAQHYIPWFAVIVAIMGITSCLGLYLAALNSNARITFSSAREGILPSVLARLTRGAKPVPYVSVFLYAGLVLALIVIPGIWLKAIDIFAYEATIGTVLVVLVYLLTNLALPLYFWKKHRTEFNWFKHLLVPIVGIGGLALPIWGFFAPGQPAPYNSFGWIFLGIVVVSMAWAAYVMLARPQAAKTLGTIIADE
jgi:amino acid transporter